MTRGRHAAVARQWSRETVLAVDGLPHLMRSLSSVPGEAFRIVRKTDVVSFRACALILGNTVVPIIAFIVILNHAALADIVAQISMQRPLKFTLLLSAWMLRLRPL